MKRWKSAGLWFAVFACAGLGGLGGRQWEVQQAKAAAEDAAVPTPPRARVHMPISLSPDNTRTADFPLTREAAERAARTGVLRVALVDGTYYDVRIEHETLDAQGHWSIAGHAKTRLGPQAMVLTYGERAVFGALPLPDGRVLQVRTEHGRPLIGSHAAFPQRRVPEGKRDDRQGDGVNTESFGPGKLAVIGDAIAITVLGLYTDDLLALRDGDVDAIATEFASMLAIANQAHMDSASLVHFENAGLRAAGRDFADNDTALAELAQTDGVREARDATAADLVTLLRPRGKSDTSCGAAFRAADRMARNSVTDRDGFSVVDVAPCGPYTLAHQLGHNLGNAHEHDGELSDVGELRHGAYYYAFAHKTRTFATLDAEEDSELPVIGRFSNPLQNDCDGVACGIDDVVDNVRSMQSIAAEVAAYRGVPGTISIADAVVVEPTNTSAWATVPIRITGAAVDEKVVVEIVGGTATSGLDYSPGIEQPFFNPGASETTLGILVMPDGESEADETILLRISRLDTTGTTTLQRTTATLTIVDPPRVMLTGRVRGGEGVTLAPDVTVLAIGTKGNDPLRDTVFYRTVGPDYTFAIPVVRGASVRLELPQEDAFYTAPVFVNDIRDDRRYADLTVQHSVPVMIRYPMTGDGMIRFTHTVGLFPPVSGFANTAGNNGLQFTVPPGARVRVDVDMPSLGSQGRVFDDVRAPIDHTLQLATMPSVYIDAARRSIDEGKSGESRPATFVVRLSAPSAQPVSVDYRTVDGTAKAGSDYFATTGHLVFEPGQTFLDVPVTVLGDGRSEYPESFELLIEGAAGALATNTRLKMTIADDDMAQADVAAIR